MIKQLPLEDAFEERPSRSQITRLAPGDDLQLCCNGVRFWVKLLRMVTTNDMVGSVIELQENMNEVSPGDLVSFEIKHIIGKIPDPNSNKLPNFMLLSHPAKEDEYVFHLNYPQMIAKIVKGDRYTAVEYKWLDLPPDKDAIAPQLLKEMSTWYFYLFINNEK